MEMTIKARIALKEQFDTFLRGYGIDPYSEVGKSMKNLAVFVGTYKPVEGDRIPIAIECFLELCNLVADSARSAGPGMTSEFQKMS